MHGMTERRVKQMSCEHDKVYAPAIVSTNPTRRRWICRKCGERGIDIVCEHGEEYHKLRKAWNTRKKEDNT